MDFLFNYGISQEDIPKIIELLNQEHKNRLFGMSYSETTFEKLISKRPGFSIDNYYLAVDTLKNIYGVCAAWDCTSFKQNRVIKYGIRFLPARIGHWFLAGLYGLPPLPEKGAAFKDITIIDYAVMDRNINIMTALLKAVFQISSHRYCFQEKQSFRIQQHSEFFRLYV